MDVRPDQVAAAAERIRDHIDETPVLTNGLLNERIGAQVFLKCENFQRTGSYKMRGATNAILLLPTHKQQKGVVTHSSGNFAQALALASKSVGVPAYIVMPEDAPEVKRRGTERYGANITICQPGLPAREAASEKIIKQKEATFVHPSNDIHVIYGQGTAAFELLSRHPGLDHLIAPVGGGGLLAGTVLASIALSASCDVWGAEPFEVDDAYRSIHSGKIETNKTTNTVADGLRTQLGDVSFPIIKDGVTDIIRVTEEEILSAMQWTWEHMKIIIEPSSAVALAALIREKDRFKDQKVGTIISGGNTPLDPPIFVR